MHKIGILTFHGSHNYGSMLQAYALQHYLESIGHHVKVINLRHPKSRRMYAFPLDPRTRYRKRAIETILNVNRLYGESQKWFKFEKFLSNDIHLTEKVYSSWQDVKKDINKQKFDIIITGGDQIWNMRCYDFDESFYLPEKMEGLKKMSYGPSMGANFLKTATNEEIDFIQTHLADYDAISVREAEMKEYLSKLLNKEIHVVVDPAILLKAEDYTSCIKEEPIIKGKYIFYYTPYQHEYVEEIALMIGKKLKIPVVSPVAFNKKMKFCLNVGPWEFLNLFKNAELVIGKSFHLIVFSLLFHKRFFTVDRTRDSRINNILENYDLTSRGDINKENYLQILDEEINFDKIDALLDKDRKNSQSFLLNNLSC